VGDTQEQESKNQTVTADAGQPVQPTQGRYDKTENHQGAICK